MQMFRLGFHDTDINSGISIRHISAIFCQDIVYHEEIIHLPLPDFIQRRITGKSRVSICNVGELELYWNIIHSVSQRYQFKYPGTLNQFIKFECLC